jgi:glycosyltransferase involved in cell wall biosynthesis
MVASTPPDLPRRTLMKISVIVLSKDEEGVADTLGALAAHVDNDEIWGVHDIEVMVVDASEGRLAHIAAANPSVRWIDFSAPPGVRVSIPHQRNAGVNEALGEIIAFIDAGCIPVGGWLTRLLGPILAEEERVTCGPMSIGDNVYSPERGSPVPRYVEEAPTANLAFRRELYETIGGFDESFEYGSDVDFTWRLVAGGAKIRFVGDAVVDHDWGSFRRQLKRSRQYGQARIRLYRKHRHRQRSLLANDPVPVLYSLYILGLPLALRYRSYLLLVAVPLWRARKRPYPVRVVACHFAEGVGSLKEITAIARGVGR